MLGSCRPTSLRALHHKNSRCSIKKNCRTKTSCLTKKKLPHPPKKSCTKKSCRTKNSCPTKKKLPQTKKVAKHKKSATPKKIAASKKVAAPKKSATPKKVAAPKKHCRSCSKKFCNCALRLTAPPKPSPGKKSYISYNWALQRTLSNLAELKILAALATKSVRYACLREVNKGPF